MRAQAAAPAARAIEPAYSAPRAASASVQPSPPVGAAMAQAGSSRSLPGETRVRYLGQAPVRVRGPLTGRSYVFSAAAAEQAVAAQDAPALLGSGQFRRA